MTSRLSANATLQQVIQAYNALAATVDAQLGQIVFGTGFRRRNTGEGMTVGLVQPRPHGRGPNQSPPSVPCFWAKITGSANGGMETENRWNYSFVQVEQVRAAYGVDSWRAVTDGHSGTARNLAEIINTNSGVQGTGVDVDKLAQVAPGMEHQPIPSGSIVVMYMSDVAGETQYWFRASNGIDGTCEAPA